MKDGFIKAAAATPNIRVADVAYNTKKICEAIETAAAEHAKIIVFPELCVTGYTCGDLFAQDILLEKAKEDSGIYKRQRRSNLCRCAALCRREIV